MSPVVWMFGGIAGEPLNLRATASHGCSKPALSTSADGSAKTDS